MTARCEVDGPLTSQTLIRGGTVIVDPSRSVVRRADVLIDGCRVIDVSDQIPLDGKSIIDAEGKIVMPGLIDSHRHLWQTTARGLLIDASISDFFKNFMPHVAPLYRPEDVYAATLLGALEAAGSGVTTFLDWCHILHTPEHADAAIQALAEARVRTVFAFGAPATMARDDRWHEDAARVRETYFSSGGLMTMALAVPGPDISPIQNAYDAISFARDRLAIPTTMHVGFLGTGRGAGGVTQLAHNGLLGADINLVHCTISSNEELESIRDTGTSVSVTPAAELALGMGTPPTRRLLAIGSSPALGTDSVIASSSDMFEQMRITLLADRFSHDHVNSSEDDVVGAPQVLTSDVLEACISSGARACGIADIGTIAPGMLADLIIVREPPEQSATSADLVSRLVLNGNAASVETVMVNGAVLKQNGALIDADMGRAVRLAEQSLDHLQRVGYSHLPPRS